MKSAETILKEKLINIKIDNPDLTFNKVIEAMQEHTQQHLKALAEDIKINTKAVCDNCGKVNPKLIRITARYTKCQYNETNSYGKPYIQTFGFPIKIKWIGFWQD